MQRPKVTRGAFGLLEILIAISVVAVLISLLMSATQRVRAAAARTACANKLKQQALALHAFEATERRLPTSPGDRIASVPEALLSWQAAILPYIEQGDLWKLSVHACEQEKRTYISPPHVGYRTVIQVYACPSDSRLSNLLTTPSGDVAAFSSYVGVRGSYDRRGWSRGVFGRPLESVGDGSSSTLMIGERPPPDSLQAGRWYSGKYVLEPFGGPDIVMNIPEAAPSQDDIQCNMARSSFGPGQPRNPCDRFHFWSLHSGGSNFALADGSIRFINYSAADLMPYLATANGGEIADTP